MQREFTEAEIDRIVGIAWEDRTTFDVIKDQFGVSESEVVKIMRAQTKPSSFKVWRERIHGRKTKHRAKAEKRWTDSSRPINAIEIKFPDNLKCKFSFRNDAAEKK